MTTTTTTMPTSLAEASSWLAQGKITSTAITQGCLKRLTETSHLNAFLHVASDAALAQAKAADQRRAAAAALGPLDGIPLALKDNLMTQAMPTTCASRILADFMAPYDATAVTQLVNAGMVVIGKTNMDEFAMGSSNENSAFGVCLNPWDESRVPGGSSGGSAVAVATGSCLAALGSDTGGSIRQPAAFTGVVGCTPSYGRVSRYGLVAYSSSLDRIGPLTQSVEDCAMLLQAIAGHDKRDSTTAKLPVPNYCENLRAGVRGMRIGVPSEYWQSHIDKDVLQHCQQALQIYRQLGAEIHQVSLPHTDYAIATYYVLAPAEASSNLSRFDGVRYGGRCAGDQSLNQMYIQTRSQLLGVEVQRRILTGTYVLAKSNYEAVYQRAQKGRRLITEDFTKVFKQVDVLFTPTTPTPAFLLGSKQHPTQMYAADILTVAANLAGICGLSLPCGFTQFGSKQLPVGLQLLAAPFAESTLLQTAWAFEQAHKEVS